MVYITGNIPGGTYDPGRLANLNLGFVAYDAGAGYTYFDQKTGHEFSVVGGFTYSLMNTFLQYRNGIDFHLDWTASQLVSKNVQIGLAGYLYQQVTGDRGPDAKLGPFMGTRGRHRPADRLHHPHVQGVSGLSEHQRVQGCGG
jgi:hypothetical protein